MKAIHALIGASLGAAAHGDAGHMGEVAAVKKKKKKKKKQKPWGIAGDAKAVKRTIEITMTDTMCFTPDRIEVKQGETVKFVVKNAGKMLQEFVIGTKKDLDEPRRS